MLRHRPHTAPKKKPAAKAPKPKQLASITITGNSEGTIGAAIASVAPWVDRIVIVDTGITDGTLKAVRAAAQGKPVTIRKHAWNDNFSDARNAALAAAAGTRADWAVLVDSDETIDLRGEDVRRLIETVTVRHLSIAHESGTYYQPRFFALPAAGKFEGPTHEAYPAEQNGGSLKLARAVFCDKPKTPEQFKAKCERDERILQAHTAANPYVARWWYYLGDTLASLGRTREAIDAFERRAELQGWDEEGAWACYRAAMLWTGMGQHERALRLAVQGLGIHAGIAELAWVAALCCYRLNRDAHACTWANHSLALGCYQGLGDGERIGFRAYPGLYENPLDVLRYALKRMGKDEQAAFVEESYAKAKAERAAKGR